MDSRLVELPAARPSRAAELQALRAIDAKGLRSLEEVLHLSFDVDERRTVWIHQFGWLRRRDECQVFRVDADQGLYRVFAIPQSLQRLAFAVFCVGGRLLYLLGCPVPSPRVPSGYALDRAGRIAGAFHLGMTLLDAVVDPGGGLWIVGVESGARGSPRVVLERRSIEDRVDRRLVLEDWPVGQLSCLSWAGDRLLLGGTDRAGATRIEAIEAQRRSAVACANVGQPLALGYTPAGELLCLGATGRLVRLEPQAAADVVLRDAAGRELRGIAAVRVRYRELYALGAKRDRIFQFSL